MLNFVGKGKRVVDFGCATGYLAKLLVDEGCSVVGVEINPNAAKAAERYCERVIIADLDYENIADIFGDEKFDVATFGDVLEHLKDPWHVLRDVQQILQPEGHLVASIPNIAHGAVRLALLHGAFDYEELGLLDNTHLRFFNRKSLHHLFESTGYFLEAQDNTLLPVFNNSSLTPKLDRSDFSEELLEDIAKDPDAEILQFVVRAYPWSTTGSNLALKRAYDQVHTDLKQLDSELQQTRSKLQRTGSELELAKAELAQTQSEFHQTKIHLQDLQAELQQTRTGAQQTQVELQRAQAELPQTQAELQRVQAELQQVQAESMHFQQVVQAMESSKFWNLRKFWFDLKSNFLPMQE